MWRSSSAKDGGKEKFVGSPPAFKFLESFNEFACTGDRGPNLGERLSAAGGGVERGTLEGVLPAAAFFSICHKNEIRNNI